MKIMLSFLKAALCVITVTTFLTSISRADHAPRAVLSDAVIDLRTIEGVDHAGAQWRFSDTQVQPIQRRDAGPDLKPSGPDSTVVFEIVMDDYSEIWVNGKGSFVQGQTGGAAVSGWNTPNRAILTKDAQPGQKFQIAVLAINGPVSAHPENYIWIRGATLDFYRPGKLNKAREVKLEVERKDPALDAILPANLKLEKVADGFAFTEGPIWIDAHNPAIAPDSEEGFLLFSDPNNNTIYRMTTDGDVNVYRTKSGYTGENIRDYGQPGSNGLTMDEQGRLTICQHGNRRVVRIEKKASRR